MNTKAGTPISGVGHNNVIKIANSDALNFASIGMDDKLRVYNAADKKYEFTISISH